MIDWMTGKFWITHNPDVLRSGRVLKTKMVDGVEVLEYETASRLSVKGSHDSSITIRSHTDGMVEISGILQNSYRVIIFSAPMILGI